MILNKEDSIVNQENRHLTRSEDACDLGLLDVVSACGTGEDDHLRCRSAIEPPLHLLKGFFQSSYDLVGVSHDEEHVGFGVGFSGPRVAVGEEDAACLGDKVLAVGDAHQLLLRRS